MRQHEITRERPLLDSNGNIAEPGFARSLLPVYRRADVKAPGAQDKGMGLLPRQQRALRPRPHSGRQRLYGPGLHILPGL